MKNKLSHKENRLIQVLHGKIPCIIRERTERFFGQRDHMIGLYSLKTVPSPDRVCQLFPDSVPVFCASEGALSSPDKPDSVLEDSAVPDSAA